MIPLRLPRVVTPNFLYWLAMIEPRCRPFIMTTLKSNLYQVNLEGSAPRKNMFALLDGEGLTLNFSSFRQVTASLTLDEMTGIVLRPGKIQANYTPLYAVHRPNISPREFQQAEEVMLSYMSQVIAAFYAGNMRHYFWDPAHGAAPMAPELDNLVLCSSFIGDLKHYRKSIEPRVDPTEFPIYFTMPFAMWAIYHGKIRLESAYHQLHHVYNQNKTRVIFVSYGLKNLAQMDDNLLRLQDIIDDPQTLVRYGDGEVMMDFGSKGPQKIYTLFYDRKVLTPTVKPFMINRIMWNYVMEHEIRKGDTDVQS